MQTATILLALGGHKGNTLPKHDVTPAEVAVLRLIHGSDAVTDIAPTGTVKRTHREERQRLVETYGRRVDGNRHAAPAIDALFPGVASRVFENFDELDLPEEFFKAASRVTADGTGTRPVTEAAVAEQPAPEAAEETGEEPDDGIGEMNDGISKQADTSLFQ